MSIYKKYHDLKKKVSCTLFVRMLSLSNISSSICLYTCSVCSCCRTARTCSWFSGWMFCSSCLQGHKTDIWHRNIQQGRRFYFQQFRLTSDLESKWKFSMQSFDNTVSLFGHLARFKLYQNAKIEIKFLKATNRTNAKLSLQNRLLSFEWFVSSADRQTNCGDTLSYVKIS